MKNNFKRAFDNTRKAGKGIFVWNGKTYNTMLASEQIPDKQQAINNYRNKHTDFNSFITGLSATKTDAENGGWHYNPSQSTPAVTTPTETSKSTEKSNSISFPLFNNYKRVTDAYPFTNDDIKKLNFNDYTSLVKAVANKDNENNVFALLLKRRFGDDVNKWNQKQVEKDLDVSGPYNSFGGGDFGDMYRSMEKWYNQGQYNPYFRTELNNIIKEKDPSFDLSLKYKNGGTIMINKYQEGGQAPSEQSIEEQVANLVIAAQQGNQQAQQQIQQIQQAAQKGDQQAQQLLQVMQQVVQQMQQETKKAKFGAKLNYIKQLKGECPEGQELTYFKAGGRICKACMGKALKNGGTVKEEEKPMSPIDQFKKEKNLKNKKAKVCKHEDGGQMPNKKVTTYKGKKLTKDQIEGRAPVGKDKNGKLLYMGGDGSVGPASDNKIMEKCGGKMKSKIKKHYFGGKLTNYVAMEAIKKLKGI